MTIQMYLKYIFTYKNAVFCILCIDDFKILQIFNKLSTFSTIFHRETMTFTLPRFKHYSTQNYNDLKCTFN